MMMSVTRNKCANQSSRNCFATKGVASSEPVSLLISDINIYRGELNVNNKFIGRWRKKKGETLTCEHRKFGIGVVTNVNSKYKSIDV